MTVVDWWWCCLWLRLMIVVTMHNVLVVKEDVPVVKIFQVVSIGAYYPPVATTGTYYAKNREIRV